MTEADPVRILMAEDDDDDFMLTEDAFKKAHVANELQRVKDGEELLDYLYCRGDYQGRQNGQPAMVLLDLNMPRMDGREALRAIREDPKLKSLPVVVLTTSKAEEDIVKTYDLGANSYIRKPVTFEGLAEAVSVLSRYWFQIVELPTSARGDH